MGAAGRSNNAAQQSLFGTDQSLPDDRKEPAYAVMNCDGASSGNPGRAGIGVLIRIPRDLAGQLGLEEEYSISRYIGETTNNVAEYTALIEGLKKALDLGIRKIRISLDSELIVEQLKYLSLLIIQQFIHVGPIGHGVFTSFRCPATVLGVGAMVMAYLIADYGPLPAWLSSSFTLGLASDFLRLVIH